MYESSDVEIKRILDILKGKKIVVATILILFTLFGCFYSYKGIVPKYQSTSTLLLVPENTTITNTDLTLNSGLISTYSSIVKNPKVLNATIDNLGLDMTEAALSDKIQVKVISNTYIIEITVTDFDAQKSMEIAKEITNVFLNEIKEIYNLSNVGVIDEASLPEKAYNINHARDIAISIMIGVIASMLFIMAIYIFDNTIQEEKDIEKYIKIQSLGSIPIYNNKDKEIVNKQDEKTYIAECINTIRTNILYMNSTKHAKTILVTSCTPMEGKSWVSANIAVAFAAMNKRVLLIDADMRKGRANGIFDVDNEQGLSDYLCHMTGNLTEDAELGKKYITETGESNLHVLTNGTIPPNPSELLDSNSMKELLTILKEAYDVIIVDAPPCKLVTDSIILSTIVDSTLLVANEGKTKINDLQEVSKSIQNVDGKIIGAIINKAKEKKKTYGKKDYYINSSEDAIKQDTKKDEVIHVYDVMEQAKQNLNMNETFDVEENAKILDDIEENVKQTDYTEQINQIIGILKELKNDYIELANMVKETQNKQEEIQNQNVIDIRTLQAQRDKEKVYSIDEEIPYEELEKSAIYIIPISRTKAIEEDLIDNYKTTSW